MGEKKRKWWYKKVCSWEAALLEVQELGMSKGSLAGRQNLGCNGQMAGALQRCGEDTTQRAYRAPLHEEPSNSGTMFISFTKSLMK